jgi:hypothetical protein
MFPPVSFCRERPRNKIGFIGNAAIEYLTALGFEPNKLITVDEIITRPDGTNETLPVSSLKMPFKLHLMHQLHIGSSIVLSFSTIENNLQLSIFTRYN